VTIARHAILTMNEAAFLTGKTMNIRRCGIVVFGVVGLLFHCACSKSGTTSKATSQPASDDTHQHVVFRNSKGQQLTEEDMANETGKFDWSLIGSESVSERAKRLHELGREAGQKGNYPQALELLKQASDESPAWPYPVYDAAFTYLLQDDAENAERFYKRVDQMAPRGFFTAKTAVDCLRREHTSDLKPGMYKAYVSLEWMDDREQKLSILEQLVQKFPKFPAAWKELALLRKDDDSKLDAIEHGLAENPDGETKGILLINKAMILDRKGNRDAAMRILGDLALDPDSTLATESLAKFTLGNLLARLAK
jgi:tetratricopeptide (TPR) repeat protein